MGLYDTMALQVQAFLSILSDTRNLTFALANATTTLPILVAQANTALRPREQRPYPNGPGPNGPGPGGPGPGGPNGPGPGGPGPNGPGPNGPGGMPPGPGPFGGPGMFDAQGCAEVCCHKRLRCNRRVSYATEGNLRLP